MAEIPDRLKYRLEKPYDISHTLIQYIFVPNDEQEEWVEYHIKPKLEELSLTRLEGNPLQIDEVDFVNLEKAVKDPDYGKESFYIETLGRDDNLEISGETDLIVFVIDAKTGKIYAVDSDSEPY